MAVLKAQQRKRLPKSSFALPSKKKYPIHDRAHARAALSYAARHDTEGESSTIRRKVLQRYPDMKQTGGKQSSGKKRLQKWRK